MDSEDIQEFIDASTFWYNRLFLSRYVRGNRGKVESGRNSEAKRQLESLGNKLKGLSPKAREALTDIIEDALTDTGFFHRPIDDLPKPIISHDIVGKIIQRCMGDEVAPDKFLDLWIKSLLDFLAFHEVKPVTSKAGDYANLIDTINYGCDFCDLKTESLIDKIYLSQDKT
jgi:hypothetical protein